MKIRFLIFFFLYLAGVNGLCVELWYFMYGRDIGSLNIYFMTGGGVYEELVWSRNGTRGPQWLYGQVSNVRLTRYED